MQAPAIPVLASWIALVPALWVADLAAAREVYKWVDEHGKVHYGDRPLPGAQSVRLRDVPGVTPMPGEGEEKRERLLQVLKEQRQEKREEVEAQKKRKEERERNCNLAKDQLRNYEQAGYIYEIDKKGNRVIYDEEKQAAAVQTARDAVKQWCGKV
ncbi:MAG: DUF4124 domain-containing protein [Gammaproteobacteria bacterium]